MDTGTRSSSSMVHRGRLESPFFRAKFRVPTGPRHFVPRPRLLTLLDDLTEYPVTAVVAPAGAGKTVLAADWLEHCRRPSAWLTLDATDDDASQLWCSLVTALDILVPGTFTEAGRRLRPGEDVSARLARLPCPDGGAAPMMLVVDDVDRVDDSEAAGAVLAAFVEHRPAWLHLLLLSRRRPHLQVDRLRASGDLADIHFGALRFSPDEAAALLTSLCPDLEAPVLGAAVEHADGWAAALQLTGLAIRSHGSTAPRSSLTAGAPTPERLVNDYLWEEVLGPERPELVGLLLSTAIVRRVNYGLAEALTQRPDAGDLLEEAEAAGLFVTALDGGWFEVHRLVRDMLMTRLTNRWPEGVRRQHALAAQWFESVGDGLAALDHWLYAESPTDALRVLSDLALPLVDAGRATRVVDALEQVPTDAATSDPAAAIRYAWCQLASGPADFLEGLSVAESVTDAAPEPYRSRMETLRSVSTWLRGDWPGAAGRAAGALSELGDTAPGDPVDRFGWRLVSCGIALDEQWDDREPAVGKARATCLRDPAGRWSFDGARALGLALAGAPLDALRAAEGAKRVTTTGRYETLRVELALADAIVARELDHREPARVLLEELAETSTYPDPVMQLVAQLELVRLRISAGDLSRASAQLDQAESLRLLITAPTPGAATPVEAVSGAPPTSLVARAGVDLALATDDPATAERWAAQVSDPFWGPTCEAKILLARGRQDESVDAVRQAVPRCPRHEVVSGLVLGQALVPQDKDAAEQTVVTALELAARQGMLRTVASEGASAIELIELSAWCVPDAWMDRLRHALVPSWAGHDAQRPIDDLTDRERDVLRLLPSRLTLSEIAAELYVSQNTLKFHLRAIYRKLGAVSRAEAVHSARHMRLLPRG